MSEETAVVAYKLPDGSLYSLRKLPWDQVAKIEKAHGVSWMLLVDAPQRHGGAFVDVVRLVHHINGLTDPVIGTVADAADLLSQLVLVDPSTGQPVQLDHSDVDSTPDNPSLDEWEPTSV